MKFYFVILVTMISFTGCGLKEAQNADQASIRTLVADRHSEVDQCYQQALKRHPHLPGGKMTVRSDQHIDGSLHSTRLIGGFAGSNEVFECVADRVNTWKTSPPKTWGPVDLSFEFKNTPLNVARIEKDFGSTMKDHNQQIGECFDREVQRNPKVASGEIRFRFTRTKEGHVRDLEKLKGFTGSEPVFGCMSQIMESFRLGETPSDAQMIWSQRFEKSSGTAVRDSKGNWH